MNRLHVYARVEYIYTYYVYAVWNMQVNASEQAEKAS